MLEDNNIVSKWQDKMQEGYESISSRLSDWEEYQRLWKAEPMEDNEEDEEMRANSVVPIVRPLVDTFQAKEAVQFLGRPESMTYQIAGKKSNPKLRYLEDALQKTMRVLWNQPYRYESLKGILIDAYNYGTAFGKVMPAEDRYDVFELHPIRPWNFLFDPIPNKWKDISWGGHEKIVSKQYLENKGYNNLDKVNKNDLATLGFAKPGYMLGDEGIVLTEIWDKESQMVYTFANRKVLLREEEFPHVFPYVIRRVNIEANTIYGQGLTSLVQYEQLYATFMRNAEIDNTMRTVHTRWLVPPSVDMEDMRYAKPGQLINWSGSPEEVPIQLGGNNYSRELKLDIAEKRREAELTVGLSDVAQGRPISKRMTESEFQTYMQNVGGGRFWDTVKTAESSFYLPLLDKILDIMRTHAPDDLFDKMVEPINPYQNAAKYVIGGHLSPKDITEHKVQINSSMSSNVLSNEQELQRLLLVLRVVSTVDPNRLKAGKTIERILEEIDVPGVKEVVKSDSEVAKEQQQRQRKMAQQVANEIANRRIRGSAGGGGTPAPDIGG